jgi:GNAT superfamily N-acetyltransferase
MGTSMRTALLADHPEQLPTVADWIYREWASRRPGSSPQQVAERLRPHLGRDRLPLMVLALDGAACVPEARRGAGIGSMLVGAAEAEAARLGVRTLHLFTPDRQRFYAALGWAIHEETVHAGAAVTIMRKALDPVRPARFHPRP